MKQGDILTHRNGHTRKILGICGEVYLLSKEGNKEEHFDGYTIKQIKNAGYIIPKEQWKPEKGEIYYYVDSILYIQNTIYYSDWSSDTARIESGNCFKTEAEAQIAADKIKDLLKGL